MGRVKSLIMLSKRDLRTSKKVVDQQLKQLEEMQEYCEATRCRRNVLVEHFGEQCSYERLCNEEGCQLCDNCVRYRNRSKNKCLCLLYRVLSYLFGLFSVFSISLLSLLLYSASPPFTTAS